MVNGDVVNANFLEVTGSLEKITFIDARIKDQNTLKGTYYYADSQNKALSGDFEAIRR